MVAKITTPARMMAALYYNENKVAQNKAVCIHSEGFLADQEMSIAEKAEGFNRLNQRNERAKTKTLHISLNFDPSEKLKDGTLRKIAEAYMQKIGFGDQPYLVYRHNDAGHPHIHIVTTTIREDGSRINTHNIGRNQSEKARKEIEREFNLVVAQGKTNKKPTAPASIVAKVEYGKIETKKAIAEIVSFVIHNYLFASLPELNAILRKYGIEASAGTKGSRIEKHKGLNYRMLDKKGLPIGVPVKASSLPGKPTLVILEKLFEKNQPLKETFKPQLRARIEEAVKVGATDLSTLKEILNNRNIDLILRESPDGRVYGITFLDENNRVVINGSDLGKAYSAAHLQNRLSANTLPAQSAINMHATYNAKVRAQQDNLLELLITPEQEFNLMPGQLLKKKRKRKRKHLG
jgi:hypothetical protein